MEPIKAVIVEDETLAARRLENMIREHDPATRIIATLESVEEAVRWFRNHEAPNLVFMDIHLEDGISFQIFDQVRIEAPLIFTTAYDEYAIKAFKLKSIDYLQKPILQEDLNHAIEKYRNWGRGNVRMIELSSLKELIGTNPGRYRERYSVIVGQRIKSIEVADVAYFFSTSGITFAALKSGKQYSLDQSLDSLTVELNPGEFFRINRQYLVHLPAIANIHIFPKSRLKVDLSPQPADGGIMVSIDRVVEFKKWVDGQPVN